MAALLWLLCDAALLVLVLEMIRSPQLYNPIGTIFFLFVLQELQMKQMFSLVMFWTFISPLSYLM